MDEVPDEPEDLELPEEELLEELEEEDLDEPEELEGEYELPLEREGVYD